jgi:hypothetical protein
MFSVWSVPRCYKQDSYWRELGRAIAQAISRWFPSAAARVQTLV